MEGSARRFARVLHTVTTAFDLDLEARTVLQIQVDHTAPFRSFNLTADGEPELSPEDEAVAIGIVTASADPWARWVLFADEPIRPPADSEALPPFDEDETAEREAEGP
jgi:hypothetical protein